MQPYTPFQKAFIVIVPALAALLLLFHPAGGTPSNSPFSVYNFIAPVVDRFIIIHLLFAPVIGGLAVVLWWLVRDLGTTVATISRVAIWIFVVFYIVYETLVGTATGIVVKLGMDLGAEDQAVVSDLATQLWQQSITGDFPSLINLLASFGWLIGVWSAAFALWRSGRPFLPSLLVGLSFIAAIHPPPYGPVGMGLLCVACIWLMRADVR